MKARIRGAEIYFDVVGDGLAIDAEREQERPVALVVHGGPGVDHTTLRPRLAAMSTDLQLVFFDHRGHGRSSRNNPASWTLHEHVEDMEALRWHLGVPRVVSIGTSYGGMVAMAHAARYPEAVSHLVLIATASHYGYLQRAGEIVDVRGSSEQRRHYADLLSGQIDTATKMRAYFRDMGPLYSIKHDPGVAEVAFARMHLSPDAQNLAYRPGGFLRSFDLRGDLSTITAPTLILAGRHDWICAPEFSEEIHDLIAGSKLSIFEDSAHALSADEPERFLREVRTFLKAGRNGDR